MSLDALATCLAEAVETFKPEKLKPHELDMLVGSAIGGTPSPMAGPLLSCVDATPVLREIFGRVVHAPGVGSRVFNHSTIAFWLLRGAVAKGVASAIQDLELFLESDTVRLLWIFAIEGLNLSRPCVLDDYTRLLPWDQLPETPGKVRATLLGADQSRFPLAALVREITVPKRLLKPEEHARVFHLPEDSLDIVRCASLMGPSGAAIASEWMEVPTWIPSEGNFGTYFIERTKPQNAAWSDEAYTSFPGFYRRFLDLDDGKRARSRVPLQRLNSAMRRWDKVDAAIDTGIALQSLFGSSTNDKMVLRAARFLETTLERRKEVQGLALSLSRARNGAVHDGVLPSVLEGLPMEALLDEGFRLVARALVKMIETGQPLWEDFDLS